jgi:protein TonB
MRKYTLFLSVIVHVAVAGAVVIAPLFAAEALPSIRDVRPEWVPIMVVLPDTPRSRPPSDPRPASSNAEALPETVAFPTEAPDALPPVSTVPSVWPDGLIANGVVPSGLPGGGDGDRFASPPPPPPLEPPRPPVRVGGAIEPPRKIVDVAPVYPPIAVAARREGRVILEAVIAEDGSVQEVRVLRSVPLLDQAAIDAVRQWRFTPTRLNGAPIQVLMSVTVAFVLQ